MTQHDRPPAVTVVMIFLNGERFLAEAIESVLAQTFRDFELVLVDDGSTDRSTAIAKGYAHRYSERVRYTEHANHENRGMSASRNRGVAAGCGRLISFLDADDIWLPGRLERFVGAIEAFPATGMVYGPTLYWYSWPGATGNETAVDTVGRLELPIEQLLPAPTALRKWLDTESGCVPGIGSLIVRREAFDAVGGFEVDFRGLYEDQAFLSKMAAVHPVVLIPDVLDYYRQHPDSCCSRSIETGEYDPNLTHPARRRYLFWLEGFLKTRGVTDAGVHRALRREVRPYKSRLVAFYYNARRRLPLWTKDRLKHVVPAVIWRGLRRTKLKLRQIDSRARGLAVGIKKL